MKRRPDSNRQRFYRALRVRRFETLEERWLLAGLHLEQNEKPEPAWFADSVAAIINPAPKPDPDATIEPLFVGPRKYVSTQWVARLSPHLIEQVGNLEDIGRLLSTSKVEVQAERGLGLAGLVQLRTLAPSEAAASDFLSTHPEIVNFARNSSFAASLLPNDAEFGNQFGLESSGQFGTLVDADIDASQAWDTSTGSTQVVVGVIDSGIDLSHPDLYLNVWINQGEIPASRRALLKDTDNDGLITFYDLNSAVNASLVSDLNRSGYIDARDLLLDARWTDGIDTDRNGFVDDFFGWNFREALDEPFEPNDPSDASGHGTHVSGILAAVGNNGVGIAGLNWRSSIMALKFLDQNNQGNVASAIAAVNYATMMRHDFETNVRVLNNSWGQAGSFSQSLSDALEAAQSADILVVAAAGNGNVLGNGVDNDRTPFYPASYPLDNLVSVAASDGQDRLASFSNYGATSVDLIAPGVGIRSTLPGGRYGDANGTSMATPLVTGTAALIWSALPQASASEVRQALLTSADPITSTQSLTTTGGRLNAARAIGSNVFAPVATLVSASDAVTAGASLHEITVRFFDRNGLDVSSLGDNDLVVEHLWGERESVPVRLKVDSIRVNGSGTEATATYAFTPPGGSWDVLDFGTYQVNLVAHTVRSRDGRNSNRAQNLGQFRVQIESADVIYVNTFQDNDQLTSLRRAVEQANQNPSRSFTILIDTGTYQLDRPFAIEPGFSFGNASIAAGCNTGVMNWSNNQSGDLDVLGNVTIVGDSASGTTLSGQNGDRLFKVHVGGSLTLKRLTLTGGAAPFNQSGGAILSAGNLALDQVNVVNNSVSDSSSSPARGGAIAALAGSVSINQSRLSDNQASFGGGVFACGPTQLNIARSTIDNNHGGGVVSYATVDGAIESSTIANNFEGAVRSQARDFPGGNGASYRPGISLDGRVVSFLSDAMNLVAGDNNSVRDAFLLDRTTQNLQMLSVSSAGQAALSAVDGLVLSGDGQQAAFLTQAGNLVSGDNLRTEDVFVRNVSNATTTLISTGASGRAARGIPALSSDGRFVAYQQAIAGDPFNTWAVYVNDRQLGTTQRLSLNGGSFVANIGYLDQTSISGDGRYVVLSARSSGTADGRFHEIYVLDRTLQTIRSLISRPASAPGNGSLYSASISGDGRYIAFASDDTQLVSGDTNGVSDIFVVDTTNGLIKRVSTSALGQQAIGPSSAPAISADGQFIAFSSVASNLVADDTNGQSDVFVVNRDTSVMERVSVSVIGLDTNGASDVPALSGDGRYVVYQSTATNIVLTHANHQRAGTDKTSQIYLRDRLTGRSESISAFDLSSTLRVTNSTLAYNIGSETVAGNVTIHNSLLAGNSVGFDLGSRSASAGFSIYASASPAATPSSTDRQNSDTALKLGPLTTLANLPPGYPLLQGNPAIDSGANQAVATLDQWNRLRIKPDVGALEALTGSISGRVFADLNGNRVRDPGEPGLSDELVMIDDNNDGLLQAGERSQLTARDLDNDSVDETGQYEFEHVSPGAIVVRSTVPNQWLATALPTSRITSGSVQGNGASTSPVISPSGNTIAFLSSATNFAANDDARPNIFVYSRVNGSLERIPIEGANLQVLDMAGAEDRWLLLRNDTGIYLWDRQLQSLRAISVSSSGQLANAHSDGASISDDGRWIAFSSFASNLVPGDNDAFADIFLVDLSLNSIISVSRTAAGQLGNNDSESPSISSDGKYVAFVSDASNLVAGDTNALGDIFVYDTTAQSLRRVNTSTSGAQSNGFTYPPQISGNGRFIVFQSLASNLVDGDLNPASNLFVSDLQTGTVERLNIPWLSVTQVSSVFPSISFDGQYVTFEATASQLNHPDATKNRNVFVYDRFWNSSSSNPQLQLISRDARQASANGDSRSAIISPDGTWMAFQSTATNLVVGDTNSVSDIFIATNPAEDASRRINLQVGQAVSDLDIGLQPRAGKISGTLFNDVSQDGVYDVGDPILSGWTVFLDANANGRRDVSEVFTASQVDGTYQFADVPAYREHVVAVELPSNWEQVAPQRVPGQPKLFLPAGAAITGRDFGFRAKTTVGQSDNAIVEGRVFNDLNGNGTQDINESAIASMEVYLDMDGNGRRDFGEQRVLSDAQGNYRFTGLGNRSYSIRVNNGEGVALTSPLGNRFTSSDQVFANDSISLSQPQAIAIADFDGRNGPDLAIALYMGNSVVLKLNNGAGGFTTNTLVVPLGTAGQGPIAISSGQLNGLGNADLVVANSLNNTLSVLLDFNGTAFSQQRTINVGAKPLDVLIADVDGDGDNDMAVVAQASNFAGQLRLFINDGKGAFTAGSVLGTGGTIASAVAGSDLNGDGAIDFVIANQGDVQRGGQRGNVAVLLSRGVNTYAPAVTYSVGAVPMDVAVADLNGDRVPDLAVVNFDLNTASILRGTGSGVFQVSSDQLSVGEGPVQIELLDIEGDRDIDMLVTNLTSKSVSILRNRQSQSPGSGFAFEPADGFGVAGFSIAARLSFATADLDASGTLDLALVNSQSNSLKILSNSLVLGTQRVVLSGSGTTTGRDFGVRFETLLPKLDAIDGPLTILEDSAPVNVTLTGIARGRSAGPPLRITANSSSGVLLQPNVQYVEGATTGVLSLVAAKDAVGQAIVTVEVRDAGVDQVMQTSDDTLFVRTVTVNVTPVNDPPTFRLAGNQVISIGSNLRTVPAFASGFAPGGGPDEVNQAVADYLIQVDRPELFLVQPIIDIQGTLRYQPNLSNTGISRVRVQVKDNGGVDASGIDRSLPLEFELSVIDLADGDIDFGDAPASYPVTLRANGARHKLRTLFLGAAIDNEPDGRPSADASADDAQFDDEDGIVWLVPPVVSRTQPTQSSLRAVASQAGKIDAWIDFNQDGDWGDSGEQILTSASVNAGANWLPFVVPAGNVFGTTYARVRLSSSGSLGVLGLAEDGEVEDYAVTLLDGQTTNVILVEAATLPTHEIRLSNGQFTIQSTSQTLLSVPAASIATFRVIALSGGTLYSITNPTANLIGTLRAALSPADIALQFSQSLIDLSSLSQTAYVGVQRVELAGAQSQQIAFSPTDLGKLNSLSRVELVLGPKDTISSNAEWTLEQRQQQNGQLVHTFASQPAQLVTRTATDWYNPLLPGDVNGDGVVTPIDALLIINYINQAGTRIQLPVYDPQKPRDHGFYDVSGSNSIEPLDVLLVINVLNASAK